MKVRQARTLAALATTLLTAAACGSSSGGGTSSSLPSSIGKGEGALNLVAWTGYVESGKTNPKVDWVSPFEKSTSCKINVKFADTSDEMVTLMRQGGGTVYDGVSASGDATNRLIAAGDVAEVNTDLVPDFNDTMGSLKSPKHNTVDGKHYGFPYMWGANVLMYNTNAVSPPPTSWDVTWKSDSQYKGKVAAYNSPIFIADAALYLKSHQPNLKITDPYELTTAQLDAAIKLLMQQKALVGKYWLATTDEIDPFSNGSLVVGTAWPYMVSFLKGDKKPVSYVIPKEGVTGWADTWMMSAHAKHPNCMYQWMKYTMTPDVQTQVAEFYGATPSNAKACAKLTSDIGDTANTDYHCGDNAFLAKIALWKTPLAECGDNRGKNCLDYSTWALRWQEVRGG